MTRLYLAFLLPAGLLAVLGGCEKPAQPAQQHAELSRIDQSGAPVTPRIVDGSPITFDRIRVSVVGPNNSTLGARTDWRLTLGPDKGQEYFRTRLVKSRPKLGDGEAVGLVLRCRYFDETGAATGTESLRFPRVASGNATFKDLGVNGRVARVDVEIEAIVWKSNDVEETIPVADE